MKDKTELELQTIRWAKSVDPTYRAWCKEREGEEAHAEFSALVRSVHGRIPTHAEGQRMVLLAEKAGLQPEVSSALRGVGKLLRVELAKRDSRIAELERRITDLENHSEITAGDAEDLRHDLNQMRVRGEAERINAKRVIR